MAFYMLVFLICVDIGVNLVGHIQAARHNAWCRAVWTPFIASLPEGIKANGKGVSW